jgi:hypothetical protein
MTFVKTYKQADLTLTGTMRKAQLAATATKTSRRPNGVGDPDGYADPLRRRASSISTLSHVHPEGEVKVKQCDKCHVKFSPIWWPADSEEGVLCHKCHWAMKRGNVNGNGIVKENASENVVLSNGVDGGQSPHVSIVV